MTQDTKATERVQDWPFDRPNGWNLKADELMARIANCPHMWLRLTQAKYLELRVDTRDCTFNISDRDGKPINPDEIIKAIGETQEQFGYMPYRKDSEISYSALKSSQAALQSKLDMATKALEDINNKFNEQGFAREVAENALTALRSGKE